jgi:hypothetical protein
MEVPVTDGEDAAVNPHQCPGANPVLDRAIREPETAKLIPGDDAMLAGREPRQRGVSPTPTRRLRPHPPIVGTPSQPAA